MGRLKNRRRRSQYQRRRRRHRNPYWLNNTANNEIVIEDECQATNNSSAVGLSSSASTSTANTPSSSAAAAAVAANVSSTSNQASDTLGCERVASPAKRLRTDEDAPVSDSSTTTSAANTWVDFSAELCLAKIPYIISVVGMWRWCRNKWTQSLELFRDSIFPYRVYQRELQLTRDKVLQLEQELKLLKDSNVMVVNQTVTTPSLECNCPCKSATPVFFPQCSMAENNAIHGTAGTAFPFVVPPPLPPPPPAAPPPPPPPPPPPAPIMNPVQFKSKAKKAPLKKKKESDKAAVITLTDIKNVQLKKVSRQERPKPRNHSVPVVSLSDLKGVKLRRAKSSNDENSSDVQTRLSEEAVLLRRTLKKVAMVRSPGGTPMRRKKPMDHGTGLTPLMTRALKNKFKSIRTPSPIGQPFGKTTSPKKQLAGKISLGNVSDTSM